VVTVTTGTVVTLTATVTAGGTAVTPGQVNFCDASATYCTDIHIVGTAQLTSAGTATVRFRPGIGSHSYKAMFLGTTANAFSTSSDAALTVTGTHPTTTAIAASGTAGNYTLTATVTGYMDSPGAASPTGSVSFLDADDGYSRLATAALGTGAGAKGLSFFTTLQPPDMGDDPQSVTVGDFNGDGVSDFVISDYGNEALKIFLGNGDGTFRQATDTPLWVLGLGTSVVVGDFNGDGKLDLAAPIALPICIGGSACVIVGYQPYVVILLGNGDGTFTEAPNSPLSLSFESLSFTPPFITVGDFNGDGISDLAIPYPCVGNPTCQSGGMIDTLLGNGDGTFTEAANSPLSVGFESLSFTPQFITVGDFNQDGKLDLVVANQCGNDLYCQSADAVSILLGNGDGTFTEAANSPIWMAGAISAVTVGDFNGDGIADLAVTSPCGSDSTCESVGTVSIFLGNGDGTFTETPNSPIAMEGNGIPAATMGDFNGDGIPDLAVVNPCSDYWCESAGTVSILLGNGDGTFTETPHSPVTVGITPQIIAVSDFNGDGISDFIVANRDGTSAVVLSQLTQTASATVTGISPLGSGTHNIYAGYDGDEDYSPSVSAYTSLIAQQATPTVTVTPSSTAISTVQPLPVTVAVSSGTMGPTPTGSITLTSGSFTSATTTLSSGSATINVPAGSLTVGTDTFTASYSGDSNFNAATGTASVTVTNPSFTISGTPVTVAPGAITGNVSTITVTPVGGFTGQVALTAAVTASPAGAQYPPTMSFGSTSLVSITGTNPGTATLTISTTASTRAALNHSQDPRVFWYMGSGATLACLLFFGIPARRHSRLRMLGLFAILMAFVGGILACGGGGGNSSISGTTAGSYTITVTGTSGSTTVTCPFTVTVQ
jgi:hypothetical protein